ncbi:50S ribosomal protein L23P [Halovivax asiaticus JCM 14624]|uniref:Large ribosomal subunit protein uL23 n=1 Tax=Halovivax asiaticus JCM 14624 TaxID=1227490 RepID=M0BDP1_9EURY|nr:50S ribosomal protein L23 [Halovivax asiaticus]ELZ08597.1 50S ribosomal protein L23P [Halovivax asiaticus JCM 14624]
MSSIIDYPLVTEKAMNDMDFENKLQFVVDVDAAKPEIREVVQSRFDVTVTDVNTQVQMDGTKKAIVTLSEDDDAQEVASRIGVF